MVNMLRKRQVNLNSSGERGVRPGVAEHLLLAGRATARCHEARRNAHSGVNKTLHGRVDVESLGCGYHGQDICRRVAQREIDLSVGTLVIQLALLLTGNFPGGSRTLASTPSSLPL